MTLKRIELIPGFGIQSSYKKKRKQEYWDIQVFNNVGQKGNYITPDFLKGLRKLDELVKLNKGNLKITDLYRSWEVQSTNRKNYISGKKKAYVAKPGGSFHNAGRAVDISLEHLQFEGVDRDDWLEVLWDIAIPLGFKPIIKIPDMDASEGWHLDWPGIDWIDAYKKLKYSEVAKCCVLDVGAWDPSENKDKVERRFIQSQLIRIGYYEIGKVDGLIGPKTSKILRSLGLDKLSTEAIGIKLAVMGSDGL